MRRRPCPPALRPSPAAKTTRQRVSWLSTSGTTYPPPPSSPCPLLPLLTILLLPRLVPLVSPLTPLSPQCCAPPAIIIIFAVIGPSMCLHVWCRCQRLVHVAAYRRHTCMPLSAGVCLLHARVCLLHACTLSCRIRPPATWRRCCRTRQRA